jgi:hypothetical protein
LRAITPTRSYHGQTGKNDLQNGRINGRIFYDYQQVALPEKDQSENLTKKARTLVV